MVQAGDWVSAAVECAPDAVATKIDVLTRYRRAVPFPSPGGDYYRLNEDQGLRRRLIALRSDLLEAIRKFFAQRGYLEVQTPQRVRSPGLEPTIAAEEVAGGGYLITSPELQMKRLLAAGLERFYFLGSCWRAEEQGQLHLNEFCMLEWYCAFCDLERMMAEIEALVRFVVRELSTVSTAAFWSPPEHRFERMRVSEAFRRYAGLDPVEQHHADVEDGFNEVLVRDVEPQLAQHRALFLYQYPASQAALARRNSDDPTVAERCELYLEGIEIANAFDELTDPDEQLERFKLEQEIRRRKGLPVYPIDQRFIEALREGIPPASGCALGVDRLFMTLCLMQELGQTLAFSPSEL